MKRKESRIYDVLLGPGGKEGWKEFARTLKGASGIILYHGTSDVFLERILREGIQPREVTGNSTFEGRMFGERSLESQEGLTYLIHRNLIGFGGNNAVNKHGGKLVALRTYLPDTKTLLPDEDSRKRTWHESLAWEDSCAHRGPIPPQQILGYLYEDEENPEHRLKHDLIYTPLRPEPAGVMRVCSKAAPSCYYRQERSERGCASSPSSNSTSWI